MVNKCWWMLENDLTWFVSWVWVNVGFVWKLGTSDSHGLTSLSWSLTWPWTEGTPHHQTHQNIIKYHIVCYHYLPLCSYFSPLYPSHDWWVPVSTRVPLGSHFCRGRLSWPHARLGMRSSKVRRVWEVSSGFPGKKPSKYLKLRPPCLNPRREDHVQFAWISIVFCRHSGGHVLNIYKHTLPKVVPLPHPAW